GNPAVKAPAAVNDVVVGVAASRGISSSSADAGVTSLWARTAGAHGPLTLAEAWGAGATAPGAPSTKVSWSTTSTGERLYAAGAVALMPLPDITVTPTSLTTSESGTSASFTIALNSQPTSAVTINLTNGDPTEGFLSKTSLTFSSTNFYVPQTVTVTGLDD